MIFVDDGGYICIYTPGQMYNQGVYMVKANYKKDFLALAERAEMLKFGSFKLKSGRRSPYFFNLGDMSDAETIRGVGKAYAACIVDRFKKREFNVIFGPAYKGISLAATTAAALAELGYGDVGVSFNRKEAKSHGEKGVILGHQFERGDRILIIDDVFTTGETKQDMVDLIDVQCPDAKIAGIVIGMDRKELDMYGENAIKRFREDKGIRVEAIGSVDDLITNPSYKAHRGEMIRYVHRFGVDHNPEAPRLIEEHRSIIPALDFKSLKLLEKIVKETGRMDGIGGYKIGFSLGLRYGLPNVTKLMRKHTDKTLIYDHQKAATDIPDTGEDYADIMQESRIKGGILFPHAGPITQERWTDALLARGIIPIVGGEMTHPGYKASEGGYIDDNKLIDIYVSAARQGVRNFIAPGNKTDRIAVYRKALLQRGIAPVFASPGFVAQSNLPISEVAKIAGPRFHGIVGRGIYERKDPAAAAAKLVREIREEAA